MNFFEILYAKKNGAALPANFFDLLFAKSFTPATVWGEYDGTLPAQYSANGSVLADYRIYGAAGGVGDRTENLLDYNDVTRVTVRDTNFWGLSFNLAAGDYVCKAFATVQDAYLYAVIKHSDETYSENYYIIVGGISYINRLSVSEGDVLYIFNAYTAGTQQQTISMCKIGQVMLTEGSTVPAEYIPYGYKVDMSVRSANLLNQDESKNGDGYLPNTVITTNGALRSASFFVTEYIKINQNTEYSYFQSLFDSSVALIQFFDSSKNLLSSIAQIPHRVVAEYAPTLCTRFTSPQNAEYVCFNVQKLAQQNIFIKGTPPQVYQPYSNTNTPIFIGTDPLGEDEYVVYGKGKVYRYGNNIFDSSAKSGANGYVNDRYLTSTGSLQTSSLWYVSEYMGVEFKKYKVASGIQSVAAIVEYDEHKNFLVAHTYASSSKIAFEVLSNCKFLRMSVYKNAESSTSLNALQPTDPPVPLPALPTCDGTTITDYAGQSVAVPSRFYAKYQKG